MKTPGTRTFCRWALPCLLALTCLFAAAGAPVRTASPDAALVTQLTGPATFWNRIEEQQPSAVQAFMKVHQGDHFKLPGECTLTLLYFTSGRQETWRGPVTLAAGLESSQVEGAKDAAPQPEVKLLSTRVSGKMGCSPLPDTRPLLRGSGYGIPPIGAVKVEPHEVAVAARPAVGAGTSARVVQKPPRYIGRANALQELNDAEATYRSLRQQAAADDLTPELYYLGVLAEYRNYLEWEKRVNHMEIEKLLSANHMEMEKLLNYMLAQKPGDPALQRLKDQLIPRPSHP